MSGETVLYLFIVVYVLSGAWLSVCVYFRLRAYWRARRRLETQGIREAALTEWEALGRKMRSGEASLEDIERSFFLDDVIVRPHAYELKNGDFQRTSK